MAMRHLIVAVGAVAAVFGVSASLAPAAPAGPPYANCTEAHKDGRYNIPKGDPAYSPKLDRDKDGIACEG